MHEERSFLTGMALGEYLHRLRRVEDGLVSVRADLDTLTGKMRRGAILAALWTFALLANVSTDKAAQFAVEIVSAAMRR